MIFVGIDPGLSGAVAALSQKGSVVGVWDTPVICPKKKSTKRAYLPAEMSNIFVIDLAQYGPEDMMVGIEQVHSMPGQGVATTFTFGRGLGLWEGIVAALGLPMEMVPPTRWKKEMLGAGSGSDKSISIARAQQLIPSATKYLTLKKHDGRADALLIAEYFRRRRMAGK